MSLTFQRGQSHQDVQANLQYPVLVVLLDHGAQVDLLGLDDLFHLDHPWVHFLHATLVHPSTQVTRAVLGSLGRLVVLGVPNRLVVLARLVLLAYPAVIFPVGQGDPPDSK